MSMIGKRETSQGSGERKSEGVLSTVVDGDREVGEAIEMELRKDEIWDSRESPRGLLDSSTSENPEVEIEDRRERKSV